MKFEIGKLYICNEYYLLLYPTSDTADAARAAGTACATMTAAFAATAFTATGVAEYWSKRLGKPVSFCEPNTILLVLDKMEDNEYIEVLAGNKKGWVIYRDWLGIKWAGPKMREEEKSNE